MPADIVVFLGPTLAAADARACLDACYLPPAGDGDIIHAMRDHAPSTIALVDGVFAQSPAIRHKEILWAIDHGICMYGASSMGAVRAAELAGHGMIGHGMIFRWYRRTVMADDADVAVPMTPVELGSRPLGDALVDIRLTLKRAARDRVISQELRRLLERTARSIHYSERNYRSLFARAEENGISEQQLSGLKLWLINGAVAQKRDDAISLLNHLALSGKDSSILPRRGAFEMTEAFACNSRCNNFLDIIL